MLFIPQAPAKTVKMVHERYTRQVSLCSLKYPNLLFLMFFRFRLTILIYP